MTIAAALARATQRLIKSSSARLDAEVLLAQVLNQDRTYLVAHDTDGLSTRYQRLFAALTIKRAGGMPVAYLTGHKEFFGLDFAVNQSVLIPRPETEEVVELALAIAKKSRAKTIADIGTGSGAIGITVKKLLPRVKVFATDISKSALKVACQNARRHKATVVFKQGDLLLPLKNKRLDLIIANLPYLDPKWMGQRELAFEPRRTLAAGTDGLSVIKRFLKQLKLLQPTGTVLMEIDPRQTKRLTTLISTTLPKHGVIFQRDASKRIRLVLLQPRYIYYQG